jgi:hypothetical protein
MKRSTAMQITFWRMKMHKQEERWQAPLYNFWFPP